MKQVILRIWEADISCAAFFFFLIKEVIKSPISVNEISNGRQVRASSAGGLGARWLPTPNEHPVFVPCKMDCYYGP